MKIRLAFLFVLIAMGLHYYLTNHYYELNMGVSTAESFCNINDTFSCDVTSASPYSRIFGMPLAAWGLATQLVLALLLLGWILGWTDDLERLGRYSFYLAGFSAAVSVVMAFVSSLLLKSYCLFCIGTYLSSWIVLGLLWSELKGVKLTLLSDLQALFSTSRTYLGFLVAIPASAFLINSGISKKYGAGELERYIRASILDWQAAKTVTIDAKPSMVKGASDEAAKFVIEEFADFRCGHCKSAYPSLRTFVKSHSDVQVRFYNFPLDGSCNSAIESGDGISCALAQAVTCAEQTSAKGWELHDKIFDNQSNFYSMSLDAVNKWSFEAFGTLGDSGAFKNCMDSVTVSEQVKAQAKAGENAGIQGTPSFFVNGRKLPRAQALPVLERAYQMSKSN